MTDDPGDDQHPTSAAGIIVFTSYRDGNAELYSVPETGGSARRLTNTAANETEPALSRDGSRLAFVNDVSGTPKLWISSADGSNAQPVAPGFGFAGSAEVSPSWSPSGDRIVFVATNNGTADLFVVAPGNTPVALVTGPAAEVEPAWSPNGDQIAFASDRDGDVEIYVVSVANGEIRRLTNRPGIDAQPSWLPDGRLAYTSWVDGVPRLRWLDPARPDQAGDVDLGTNVGPAEHPAPIL